MTFRYSFNVYGARDHAAGFRQAGDGESASIRVAFVGQKDLDPKRSAYIDKILARLNQTKEPEQSPMRIAA